MKVTEENLAFVLKKNRGLIGPSIDMLRDKFQLTISRQAIYKRIQANNDLKQIIHSASEDLLDVAESKLSIAINRGDMRAITFYLSRKGKSRGYIEKIENEQVNPVEIHTKETVDLSGLSKSDLKSLQGVMAKAYAKQQLKKNSGIDKDSNARRG